MTPFLKQVASHYLERGGLEGYCFVFPNKRSMAFFRKYLSDLVREKPPKAPFMMPRLLSVSDFYHKACGKAPTDRLRLMLELYESYREVSPLPESLDDFLFWGDVILSDFDDIDKYLADPDVLLANVAEYKEMQDDFTYLTQKQDEALRKFLSHFDGPQGEVKQRFLAIWNILLPLYKSFRKRLETNRMAYEGMVCRALSEAARERPLKDILEKAFPGTVKFVFTGLNALGESERSILAKMRDASLAEFCWDYSGPFIKDPENKSSELMGTNTREFPQAFEPDPDPLEVPAIKVVGSPSGVGQVKILPSILAETDLSDPVRTAIVLPESTLLLPLLESVPPEVGTINVTMGYPMAESGVFSLVRALCTLQLHIRFRKNDLLFYGRNVHTVLSNSVFRSVLTEGETAVLEKALSEEGSYIPARRLRDGDLLPFVFAQAVPDKAEASKEWSRTFLTYLSGIVSIVGGRLAENGASALEAEFAKRCHQALGVLMDLCPEVLPQTLSRLVERSLSSISVPFEGEPLGGLQIMGPLETRALDFDTLIIFSANEGVFPGKSFDPSFIPADLRRGFGLPCYDYRDAVWAYYFYRMICRAKTVWMVCDNRTEGLRSGEESRYIKQLEYHYGVRLERFESEGSLGSGPEEETIRKTPEDIGTVRKRPLSVSRMKDFLSCEAKFYYKVVRGLDDDDLAADSMDASVIGKVFHYVVQQLYSGAELVDEAYLGSLLSDKESIKALIRERILSEMRTVEVTGRDLVVERVIFQYVVKVLERDKQLLEDEKLEGFRILGLEKKETMSYGGFDFVGYIDRLDSCRTGEVRVVDYKTGLVEESEMTVTDPASIKDKLLGAGDKDRPDKIFQFYFYDMLLDGRPETEGKEVVNSVYSMPRLFTREVTQYRRDGALSAMMKEILDEIIARLTDLSLPWRRTTVTENCNYCDFKIICGRKTKKDDL